MALTGAFYANQLLRTTPTYFYIVPLLFVVWMEVSLLLGVFVTQDDSSIVACLMNWTQNAPAYRFVPLYLLRGIWRAWNDLTFKGKLSDSYHVALKIVAFVMEIGPWLPKASFHFISMLDMSSIFPIFVFDGASSGGICGCGALLRIDPYSHYRSCWSVGRGDNIRAEMMAL